MSVDIKYGPDSPNQVAAKLGDADDATALVEARTALGLSAVATSGSYSDLSNQPWVPGQIATLANMPAVTSWEFLDWRKEIVETKKAPTIWTPTTKYFISSSTGDDSNAGTQASPWQTIARVQTAIDALAAESKTVFYFLCGDTWEEVGANTTGTNGQNCLLRLNKSQVGLSSYGTGAKPFFNRFVNKHTSGWTVHDGSVYVKNVGVSVGWVRRADNRMVPFYRTSSAALAATDVADTSGSFYFDTATNDLYLNLGGTDPNTVTIEIVESNAESLELSADGTYCENLELHGYGMSTNTATQGGLRTSVQGSNTARLQNCEFYFGSSHTIHHNGFTGSGGTSVFIRCVTGFCRFNSAGETIMNSYAQGGLQETYVQDCEVPCGTLPSVDWFNPASSTGPQLQGAAFYCHTGGGAATTGFIFVDGLLCNHNLAWGPMDCDYFGSMPAAATLAEVKQITFGTQFYNTRRGMRIFRISPTSGVRLNASITGRMDDRNTRAVTNVNQAGWLINTRLDIDYTSALVNLQGIWNGDGGSTARFYHNRIIQRSGSSTHDLRIDYDLGWTGGICKNNIIARIGTYDISSGIGSGTGPETDANAFYLIKTGTVGWNAVTISTEAEAVQSAANETSYATYRKAARLPFRLGYDRLGNRRGTTTSIGDLD